MPYEPDPNQRPYDPVTPPVMGEHHQPYPPAFQPGYPQQPAYYGPPPGYPQQPGYPGPYGFATPAPPPQNGYGVTGMVLGIVSVPTLCSYVGPVVAIVGGIFSMIGLQKVKRGEATNKGMAIAGLILSIITLVLACVFVGLVATSFYLEDGFDSG